VVLVLAVGAGLFWFQPWALWQDETVREELPTAVGESTAAAAPSAAAPSKGAAEPAAPKGPRTLAVGELISHEHRTSGTVKILRLPDGSHRSAWKAWTPATARTSMSGSQMPR
jgi:hypothetical protein